MLPGSKRVAYCIACHTAQVHWRDKKLARNRTTLQAEGWHWQKFTHPGWSDEDIVLVARYLNTLYYRYPEEEKPGEQAGSVY